MQPDRKPVKVTYCAYCRKRTEHTIEGSQTDGHGTGGELMCSKCGSVRLGTIQGIDASLM